MTFYCNEKRKSYVLNPRGKPLYEDANRFGTKMLEKMGWSKGKGLGVNLDGEQNFIKVSHKVDQKGIGFEDRDDQWTQHENEFNSLLKSLDNSAAPSENEDEADELGSMSFRGFGFADANEKSSKEKKKKSIADALSGKSLEEMSKSSRARVHYKKFTRGKDLSKYSEKDLANIFGKKIEDESRELDKEKDKKAKEVDLPLSNYGITTIETGTTIGDYFQNKKNKLLKRGANAEEKSSSASPSTWSSSSSSHNSSPIDVALQEPEKKRKKKKKEKDAERAEPVPDEIMLVSDDDVKKEKKKKRKKQKEVVSTEEVIEVVDDEETATIEEANSKKKNKKKKSKRESSEDTVSDTTLVAPVDVDAEPIDVDVPRRKCKKKRTKNSVDVDDGEAVATHAEVTNPPSQIIPKILTTLIHVNNGIDSPTDRRTNESVANGDSTESSTSTAAKFQQFAHDTFEINRFQAELFRFVDLDGFKNANLSDLTGYGFTENIDLKITARTQDRNRINDLWDNALINKYGKDVIKTKKKQKYSVKTLKKKSLFKAI